MELLNEVTGLLRSTLDSPWLWLALFLVAGLDALLPFMPSETAVVLVAVLLGQDPPRLALLAVVAAAGAFAGDCASYWIGRTAGERVLAGMRRGEKTRQRYDWAKARVDEHAPLLIVGARYLPGGRVASGLATGSLRFPWRRFWVYDLCGAGAWAVYSTVVGWVGGAGFADEPAKGLLLAGALALTMLAAFEGARRLRGWLRSRRGPRDVPRRDPNTPHGLPRGGDRSGAGRTGPDVSEVDGQQAGRPPGQGAFHGPRSGGAPGRRESEPRACS
ncbi:hypothetical protein GCM10009754_66280 [Amycolatopsis minnesotensis]|uniref:VTT domain-containing protein n=1 Tax=Amycolatopsis minnesotensis TaxID=337894 RepID=A0ABP5DHJ5_9PSEU